MISPFKAALGLDYRAFEDRLLRAIHVRFSLPPEVPRADCPHSSSGPTRRGGLSRGDAACRGFSHEEAERFFGRDPGLSEPTVRDYLTPWTAARAEKQLLARFNLLLA